MGIWLRCFALAAIGAPALGMGGCAFLEKPAAVEALVQRELPPLKQRVTTVERQVADNRADLERKAERADVPTRAEVATREDWVEVQAELQSIGRILESLTNVSVALEAREQQTAQRVVSTERLTRVALERARASEVEAKRDVRAQLLLTQLKTELTSVTGVSLGQIDHAELAPFISGKAQLEPLLSQNPKAREQLDALRAQLIDGKIEILRIAAFEDTGKCRRPDDKECTTVGLRRGLAVAAYLGAPKSAVDARQPTDRWGSPRENRRVVVFYLKKSTPRAFTPATPPVSPRHP